MSLFFWLLMRQEIKLCDPGCKLFHTREFVCNQLHFSESTFYRERDAGRLRITRKGMIYCGWIREYVEKEWERPQKQCP